MSVLLVVVLGISGLGFMQLDFLERLMTTNTVENYTALYLASAGIEHGRSVMKIPDDLSWTTVLDASYDGPDAGSTPDYAIDLTPTCLVPGDDNTCLCPPDGSRGCVVLPFGSPVDAGSSTNLIFDALFGKGSYVVRAFNNLSDPGGTVDTDRKLTLRALGTTDTERKLIELTVIARSNLGIVTCSDPTATDCTEDLHPNADIFHLVEDREPRYVATLPTIDFSFYSTPSNFTWTTATLECGSGIDCSTNPIAITVEDERFYRITGVPAGTTVSLDGTSDPDAVVVYSEAPIEVKGHDSFTNTILVSEASVLVKGNTFLAAPGVVSPADPTPVACTTGFPMCPAIVSGSSVGADASVEIYGNIYSSGIVDFNPIKVHGIIVGADVLILGAGPATTISDDAKAGFYDFMPGVDYDDDYKKLDRTQSWKEIL